MPIFDREKWSRFGSGFSGYDCAIGFDRRYAFLMYEITDSPHRDPMPEMRVVVARMERPMENRFYRIQLPHFDFARIAYGESPSTEFTAVDLGGIPMAITRLIAKKRRSTPWRLRVVN
ncbi:hypothetical protein FNU76_14790 [Chitinimonas arctica]|uniref:Uncharacterized protein n=1 Tax=Chitinimonas arctica TaxID=2594795 RepID=A0A516SH82_9NEIS|nr:hypothetical protein [Chitinimonas arctica]QDQ27521.1 hypothetical protein FNU76_14790 [Chitinimonas arctica]